MTFRSAFLASALVAACLPVIAHADTFTDQLTTSDSTELGRASRSGTAQSWPPADEAYTGQINTTTTYFYKTYTFASADFQGNQYVAIDVTDVNSTAAFFVSAFANSYDPANRGANWLGDEGSSGEIQFYSNLPGTDDRVFYVTLDPGADLVLLVNSTLGGTTGLYQPYQLTVQSFSDTGYDNEVDVSPTAVTPEPGSFLLTFTGLVGAIGVARRRFALAS